MITHSVAVAVNRRDLAFLAALLKMTSQSAGCNSAVLLLVEF